MSIMTGTVEGPRGAHTGAWSVVPLYTPHTHAHTPARTCARTRTRTQRTPFTAARRICLWIIRRYPSAGTARTTRGLISAHRHTGDVLGPFGVLTCRLPSWISPPGRTTSTHVPRSACTTTHGGPFSRGRRSAYQQQALQRGAATLWCARLPPHTTTTPHVNGSDSGSQIMDRRYAYLDLPTPQPAYQLPHTPPPTHATRPPTTYTPSRPAGDDFGTTRRPMHTAHTVALAVGPHT